MHGAKTYWSPVALTSRAVAAPILFTSSGSLLKKERKNEGEVNNTYEKHRKKQISTLEKQDVNHKGKIN